MRTFLRLLLAPLLGVALLGSMIVSAQAAVPLFTDSRFIYKSDSTDTTVTISWYPTAGTKSYGVCVTPANKATSKNACPNGTWRRVFPNSTDPRQPKKGYNFVTVDTLNPSTSYKFQVRSYADTASTYAKRVNDYGSYETYATSAYATSAPTGLTLTEGTAGGTLKATWNPTGNSNYEIRWATTSAGVSAPSGASACSSSNCVRSSTTSATLSGLTPGVKYYARIRAIDAKSGAGAEPLARSPWSGAVQSRDAVPAYTAAAPTLAEPSNITANGFRVSWSTPAGFQSGQKYLVFASTTPGIVSGKTSAWVVSGNSVDITSAGAPVFGGGIGTIDRDTRYSINVAVISADSSGSAASYNSATAIDSARVSTFPPEIKVAVNEIRNLVTGSVKDSGNENRLKVSWDALPDWDNRYYKVFIDTDGVDGSSDFVCVDEPSAAFTGTYSFGGSAAPLEPRRTYYTKVGAFTDAACTSTGTAVYSDTWIPVKTPNDFDLDAPSPFRMKASGTQAIEFEWDHASTDVSYQIEKRTGTERALLARTPVGAKSTIVSGLSSGTTYGWRIRAVSSTGAVLSPWSVEITVKPSDGLGTITGQVSNVSGSVAAMAYRKGGTRDGDLAGGGPVGSDGTYVIKDLEPGADYTIHLEQRDSSSSLVSPWVTSAKANGTRSRAEGTGYRVNACASTQQVCPTVSTQSTALLAGVTVSGNLPANYGVVDVTALYGGANVGSDQQNTNVSTGRSYAIRGLWPASMGGGSYSLRLSVSGSLKATKPLTNVNADQTANFATTVPPATPSGLTITPTSSTTATVTWQAVSGAEGYRLWVGTSSAGSNPTPTMYEPTSAPLQLTGLSPSTTYYVDIASLRDGDPSTYTPRKAFTTPAAGGTSPATPSGLATTPTGPTTATVTWQASSGADGYRVWVGTSPTGANPAPTKYEPTNAPLQVTGLSPNTTYYVAIASLRNGAPSAYTSRVPFTTPASGGGGTTPTAGIPTSLRIAGTSSTALTAQWSTASPETRVYWGKRNDGGGLKKADVSGTSYTTPTLATGCYYFKVATRDGATTTSGYTMDNELVGAFPKMPSFGTPKCLNARGVTGTSGQLNISWSPVPDASGYRIYYGSGSGAATGSGMTMVDVDGGAVGTKLLMGLSSGTKYYVKITAKHATLPWSTYTANGAASGNAS